MAALLQRVMAGREEQKKQRQMDLERLLQRSVGLGRERIRINRVRRPATSAGVATAT